MVRILASVVSLSREFRSREQCDTARPKMVSKSRRRSIVRQSVRISSASGRAVVLPDRGEICCSAGDMHATTMLLELLGRKVRVVLDEDFIVAA